MTVIAAFKDAENMWVMGDRQTSWSHIVRSDHGNAGKLVEAPHGVFGASGWSLYGKALQYFLRENPKMANNRFEDEWAVESFFRAYFQYLKDHYGLGASTANEVQTLDNSSFMLVTTDQIYEICANRDISRFQNYHAIGSGQRLALAAIHALQPFTDCPQQLLTQVYQTVCHFDRGCGGDMDLINVTARLKNRGRKPPKEKTLRLRAADKEAQRA